MSEDDNVVAGLLRKRAEIAGKIEYLHSELRQLVIDLDSLDVTIRVFRPAVDLTEVKPKAFPPRSAAFKGEVTRILIDTLRETKRPMTAQELATAFMASRHLNASDTRLVRTIFKRIHGGLRHYRNRGLLKSYMGPNKLLLWELLVDPKPKGMV